MGVDPGELGVSGPPENMEDGSRYVCPPPPRKVTFSHSVV